MSGGILRIALLCVVAGAASIPLSFNINSSPIIVWLGNALGSLASAAVVIYAAEHLSGNKHKLAQKRWAGKKIVTVLETDKDDKKVVKARIFIDRHGLKIFSFFCPIFPGVLISTAAVYLLDLDTRIYKRWMVAGVFFASGAYVFGYWFTFVR